MPREDFITAYLNYVGETEAPTTFNRWAAIGILGTWLGRRYGFEFGHSILNCNFYLMFMGNAGSRKTTAIKTATALIKKAGFENVAAERSTKEKFLLDLAGVDSESDDSKTAKDLMSENLFGPSTKDTAEILISADEFNTFVGNGNIEFLSLLGVLWDYNGLFKNRVKNSKSIEIQDPTVSILAGNTATGFSLAFPAEAIGQGIFSRLILIHGEKSDILIPFPKSLDTQNEKLLIDILHAIRQVASGMASVAPSAKAMLETIYRQWRPLNDVRFESYGNRRFTHLIKLCLILSAAALRNQIEESDVIYANTLLTHAEHSMPQALGEFGKGRHSDVAHKIVQRLNASYAPLPIIDLWKAVHTDLESMDTLKDLLNNLTFAGKVLSTKGGFLAKRAVMDEQNSDFVDFTLLSEQERKYVS